MLVQVFPGSRWGSGLVFCHLLPGGTATAISMPDRLGTYISHLVLDMLVQIFPESRAQVPVICRAPQKPFRLIPLVLRIRGDVSDKGGKFDPVEGADGPLTIAHLRRHTLAQ